MSQIYKTLGGGGPVPPAIPTSFTTQNGSAVPDANILIINGFDSTENNDNGIITKGGVVGTGTANEVDVVITNRITPAAPGFVDVTGAVTGDIITFSLGASAAVYRFEYFVTGRDTTTGDGVGYTLFASVRTNGAVATLIKTPFADNDEDASLLAALMNVVVSGNNVILQATGVSGQTIRYKAVATYVVV